MSFNDLERGVAKTTRNAASGLPSSGEDAAFRNLQSAMSLQVFKINANVQGILRLVDQLGTGRDTGSVRKSLHDLTETTREMVKRSSDDLRRLVTMGNNLPQHKALVQKTSHDMQVSLVAFQRAQKVSAERQRTVVDHTKQAVEEDQQQHATSPSASNGFQQQQQQQQQQAQTLSPQDLAYQESLVQERETEIREIETGIHELNEIFRDLGTLVVEQGSMIEHIGANIDTVQRDTAGANEELGQASEYQRKAGRRALCLMIVVVIVICVVLLAVLS